MQAAAAAGTLRSLVFAISEGTSVGFVAGVRHQ
jgi:hypothetical protein